MPAPEESTRNAIALGEFMTSLDGKAVSIAQAISWRPGSGFERHSTVHACFSFVVERSMWTMSGGHYVLMGSGDVSYAIGTARLCSVGLSDGAAVVIERFGDDAERQSIIRVATSSGFP